MKFWRITTSIISTLILGAGASELGAQVAYPTKPITVVLPFTAGGGGDIILRQITPVLANRLKTPVLVDNRVGAGGQIGVMYVVNATPDGHTLLFMSSGIAIDSALKLKPAYDPLKDLRPLTLAYTGDQAIFINPKLPVNSVKELIAYATANPGRLNYSHPGIGSTGHLNMELFKQMAKVDIVGVPFKGSPEALTSIIAGDTQVTLIQPPASRALWETGRIKFLALASAERSAILPDIPTVAESGLPGFAAAFWYGFFTPAGMPDSLFDKIESEITAILTSADMRQKIASYGHVSGGIRNADFRRQLVAEIKQWQEVVRVAGIPRQ